MRIIHLKDAIYEKTSGGLTQKWRWGEKYDEHTIQFYKWHSSTEDSIVLRLGFQDLLTEIKGPEFDSIHNPQAMWDIITMLLLEHDILCTPLIQDEYTLLPIPQSSLNEAPHA